MKQIIHYTLTTTWNPRGEAARLQHLLPRLREVFTHVVVVLPPAEAINENQRQAAAAASNLSGIRVIQVKDWTDGRHTALLAGLETPADYIQYADMDRLLRWTETRYDEWLEVTRKMTKSECLIVGRTRAAYQTHPKALIETERISNRVVSHFLGRQVDVSAGCKGFSRKAAEYLSANALRSPALGTDAEWPLLLQRGGFQINYIEADGLDWESADRYRDQAADSGSQRLHADAYDADPKHWAQRVQVAQEIVMCALDVQVRSW